MRIHAIPPPDFLKPSRFHPQKNNIKTEWFTGVSNKLQGTEELSEISHFMTKAAHILNIFLCHFYHAESSGPATPHYNSTVLGDHLPLSHLQFLSAISAQCPTFGDGVALLKVWMRQRELDQVRPEYFCVCMLFITHIEMTVVTRIEIVTTCWSHLFRSIFKKNIIEVHNRSTCTLYFTVYTFIYSSCIISFLFHLLRNCIFMHILSSVCVFPPTIVKQ